MRTDMILRYDLLFPEVLLSSKVLHVHCISTLSVCGTEKHNHVRQSGTISR